MTTAERAGRTIHPQVDNDYLRLVSGNGVFVTDDSGREYLDAVAGIGVMSLGYGREDLVEAAANQARKISFTHSMRFQNEPQERLAQQLAELNRRGFRHSAGYGSESAREVMSSEVEHHRRRIELLDRLIEALPRASGSS